MTPTSPASASLVSPSWESLSADVLMIGSGISGLFCALKLADAGQKVLIITKNALTENNSRYAQGGIAAVLPDSDDDSLQSHINDTLDAGAGLCDPHAVEAILRDGHLAIADLMLLGVPFDRDERGQLALTLEGGHGARRIIHAGGDATGRQVELTLTDHVEKHPNIRCMAYCQAVSLIKNDANAVIGAAVVNRKSPQAYVVNAQATILATGGAGRLYTQTTNPAGATGNGFTLAYEAGCTLVDMEFVQFHPTAFVAPVDGQPQTQFLISEAVRGEGGRLTTQTGKRVSTHPQGDLAPRDIVTRAIYDALKKESPKNKDFVWLDISHQPKALLEKRFPSIAKACLGFGVDISTHPIPVAPAAHYMMGGIRVDGNGYTGVKGLYAIGESIWTGLHGANRLASNSLLECVVGARNVAVLLNQSFQAMPSITAKVTLLETHPTDAPETLRALRWGKTLELQAIETTLRQLMWDSVGVIRNDAGLRLALQGIAALKQQCLLQNLHHTSPNGVDVWQQLILADVMTQCALLRTESRGAHYRSDYPNASLTPYHTLCLLGEAPHQVALSPQPIQALSAAVA
ncbi:MAG: L-aspartate oxidase [Vampirovibrionales bacterium]|nr:L-aspartate oxidase [Vampirovibrionales bacterium]